MTDAGRVSRTAGRGLMVVAAGLLAINALWIARNWRTLRPLGAGDIAPGFTLPSIDTAGKLSTPMTLQALRGQVVLVDFWAEWCGPCKRSMPVIERVYRKHRERGFTVLSVNTDGHDEAGKARRTIAKTTFPVVSDDGHVAALYKVTTIPHLLLVDRRGVVRHVHRGFRSEAALERALDAQIRGLLAAVP